MRAEDSRKGGKPQSTINPNRKLHTILPIVIPTNAGIQRSDAMTNDAEIVSFDEMAKRSIRAGD